MISDVIISFSRWRVWLLASIYKVILQYRRTFFGTLWLAMTMVAIVLVKAFLFTDLLSVPSDRLIPSLAMGMAFWTWMSYLVVGGASAFISNKALLTQFRYPLFLPVLSNVAMGSFVFLHGFVAMLLLNMFYYVPTFPRLALTFAAFFFVAWAAIGFGYCMAHICTRFRDIERLTRSVMSVMFILTPVIWLPELVGEKKKIILELNPLYHALETLRDPIIGQPIEWKNWVITGAMGLGFWLLSGLISWRFKRNILLWI